MESCILCKRPIGFWRHYMKNSCTRSIVCDECIDVVLGQPIVRKAINKAIREIKKDLEEGDW